MELILVRLFLTQGWVFTLQHEREVTVTWHEINYIQLN